MAKKKFARHKAQSKFRNIAFEFTFEDWYNWWLSHGIDKNIDQKWSGPDRPCMCRLNDTGSYSMTNVYFATTVENVKDSFVNGSHNYAAKPKKDKIYKRNRYMWAGEHVSFAFLKVKKIPECRMREFLPHNYDRFNQRLSKKLQERYYKLPRSESLEQFIISRHYWPDPYKSW